MKNLGRAVPVARGPKTRAALAATVLALAGCTEVKVHGADGVDVRRSFGLATVAVQPGASMTTVHSKGIGLGIGQRRLTLGWLDERISVARDPESCRLVVFVQTANELAAIQRQFAAANVSMDRICTVGVEDENRTHIGEHRDDSGGTRDNSL